MSVTTIFLTSDLSFKSSPSVTGGGGVIPPTVSYRSLSRRPRLCNSNSVRPALPLVRFHYTDESRFTG